MNKINVYLQDIFAYVPLCKKTNTTFSIAGKIIIFYALRYLTYGNAVNRDVNFLGMHVKTIVNFNCN